MLSMYNGAIFRHGSLAIANNGLLNLQIGLSIIIPTKQFFTDLPNGTTFTASGLSAGMSINPNTGVITGAADNATITIYAATQSYTFQTTASVSPPITQYIYTSGDTIAGSISSSGGYTWVNYTASYLPPGGILNGATGTISGTATIDVDTANTPVYSIFGVKDALGREALAYAFFTVVTSTAPELLTLIPDRSIDVDATLTYDIHSYFRNNNPTGNMTFNASGLPAGISINQNTGVITGSSSVSSNGLSITIRATNNHSQFTEDSFALSVLSTVINRKGIFGYGGT